METKTFAKKAVHRSGKSETNDTNGQEKTTPIIVANESWGKHLPERLTNWVKEERMILGLVDMAKPLSKEEQVGWAECVAYLMPASQQAPLHPSVVDIYLYCVTKLLESKKIEVPEEIRKDELSEYNMGRLKEFKLWLYDKRGGKEKNPVLNTLREVVSQ